MTNKVENKQSIFDTLYQINVNGHVEEKNGLSYLSWAWAWGELKKIYPNSTYTIERFDEDNKPYLFDPDLGYMVFTSITIEGLTHDMWLPVMDGANKPMMKAPYEYLVNNKNHRYAKLNKDDGKYYDQYGNEQPKFFVKKVEKATMFDINKTIMRCLVKNISMFGLGLYIYAGEDLPETIVDDTPKAKQDKESPKAKQTVAATESQLKLIPNLYSKVELEKMLSNLKKSDLSKLTYDEADKMIKARSGK